MKEPFERLQEARRRARFASASDAARAFGWNENTYRSHENGERGLKIGVAERYSKAFRVSLSWLMFGAGDSQHTCYVPLWGELRSQKSITKVDPKTPAEEFELPIFVPIDALCLRVMGEGFLPRYEENDLLICTTASHFIENQEIEGLVWIESGDLVFGTVFGNYDAGFSIETMNAKTIRNITLTQISQVDAVVRKGRYLTPV